MDTATETANQIFTFINDYGALQILAAWGIACMVGNPIVLIVFGWKLGRPIARIADSLDELAKIKGGN